MAAVSLLATQPLIVAAGTGKFAPVGQGHRRHGRGLRRRADRSFRLGLLVAVARPEGQDQQSGGRLQTDIAHVRLP
jgi:hypothetical protein